MLIFTGFLGGVMSRYLISHFLLATFLFVFISIADVAIGQDIPEYSEIENSQEYLENKLVLKEQEKIGVEDLQKILELTTELLKRDEVRTFLRNELREFLIISEEMQKNFGFENKIKDISENQLYLLLKLNPKLIPQIEEYLNAVPFSESNDVKYDEIEKRFKDQFKKIVDRKGFRKRFQLFNRPSKPTPLHFKDGSPGYTKIEAYFTTPRLIDGKVYPEDNVLEKLKSFISEAKSKIYINIFEFDLMEVADELVKAKNRGVEVNIGIDEEHIHNKENREKVLKKLQDANIDVTLVQTSKLNHQKLAVIDPGTEGAKSWLSSGNWTAGGIHPGGDLMERGVGLEKSDPNANNVIIVHSKLLSIVVEHELRKTINHKLRGVRGDGAYPLSNSWHIKGPGDSKYMIISFSPNGGLGDVLSTMLSNLIKYSHGSIEFLHFANTAVEDLQSALLQRAMRDKKYGDEFQFRFIGDRKFSLSSGSTALALSGIYFPSYKEVKAGVLEAYKPVSSPWVNAFSKEEFEKIQSSIRIAPIHLFDFQKVTMPDGSIETISRIQHNKLIIAGDASTIGSSLNPSQNSLGNQEQLVILNDSEITAQARAMFDWLYAQTDEKHSLKYQTDERNIRLEKRRNKVPKPKIKKAKKLKVEKPKNVNSFVKMSCRNTFIFKH